MPKLCNLDFCVMCYKLFISYKMAPVLFVISTAVLGQVSKICLFVIALQRQCQTEKKLTIQPKFGFPNMAG